MATQTVYIIDDEEQTANLFSEYVHLLGYTSSVYNDAAEYFDESVVISRDSVMILDLNMPGMDGIEVMRRMVETGKIVPLILVSGYDSGILHSAEQLAKAYSLDIIATLEKPFTYSCLKDILGEYKTTEKKQFQQSSISISPAELSEAIHLNQLVLHYQPQIDIPSGNLIGVEALVRWQHPQHGLIYPDSFITLAENNGLIGDLTEKVIELALQQTLEWKGQGMIVPVSVNISAENITSLSLPEQLSVMLKDHDLDPSMLTLEVTESSLMGQLITSLDILTRLRMKGFNLSIDDFGTGFSSLSQLYRMPFTELKVDLSFVMQMLHDDEARGIVKTCIILAHELKMKVVAEGVEDRETLDLLATMGCDYAQGYYIAKPMPADNLISWENERSQYMPPALFNKKMA